MCGIAGIVLDQPGESSHLRAQIQRMILNQRDRGPDRQDWFADERVAMGCARLQITGGFLEGAQPIADPDGGLLVFNGEIYDHARVLRDLGVEPSLRASDGVALAAILARRGLSGLNLLRGMFGAARYDTRTGKVLLVRDAVGKKPLYVRRFDGGWAFASKIESLAVATGPVDLRPEAIEEYLVYRSVGGCHSAFRGITQVPPGGFLEIDRNGVTRRGRWWQLPETTTHEARDIDVGVEVQALIRDSVDTRTHDDHDAGIFLSGGLDSSIIAACLARQSQCRERVRAFAVGYDVAGFEDERDKARGIAQHLSIPIEEVIVRAAQIPDLMFDVAKATEDPIQDPVTLPTLALSRRAVEYSKIVFTGDGSDEIWGGYARFEDPPDQIADYLRRTTIFSPTEIGKSAPPTSYLDDVVIGGSSNSSGSSSNSTVEADKAQAPLDRILRLEVQNRMRNYHLARVDKITMSVGLEARSPFLDINVVSDGLALPSTVKRPGGRAKGLLTSAFAPWLPSWLVARKKQPFSVPTAAWLKGPLRDFATDTLLASNAFVRAWTDPQTHLDALAAKVDGNDNAVEAAKVWSLVQLEIWHRATAPMRSAS